MADGVYKIDPAGIQGVLTQVQTDAQELEPILNPLQGWVESAAEATGGSGAVVPALQEFFTAQSAHLDSILTRVEASINGAVNATTAYSEGDYQMMLDYQTAAAAAVLPSTTSHVNQGMY